MKTGDNMKEHPQRLELRERIIDTALNSFATHGIKSITMDDIAAALGISKRTLYEVFADKESLLKECILQKQAERDKYLQEIYEQSNNVLEVILAVFQKSNNIICNHKRSLLICFGTSHCPVALIFAKIRSVGNRNLAVFRIISGFFKSRSKFLCH